MNDNLNNKLIPFKDKELVCFSENYFMAYHKHKHHDEKQPKTYTNLTLIFINCIDSNRSV